MLHKSQLGTTTQCGCQSGSPDSPLQAAPEAVDPAQASAWQRRRAPQPQPGGMSAPPWHSEAPAHPRCLADCAAGSSLRPCRQHRQGAAPGCWRSGACRPCWTAERGVSQSNERSAWLLSLRGAGLPLDSRKDCVRIKRVQCLAAVTQGRDIPAGRMVHTNCSTLQWRHLCSVVCHLQLNTMLHNAVQA